MRTNKAIRGSSTVVMVMLCLLVIGLLIAGLDYGKAPRRVNAVEAMSQSKTEDNQSLDYHVWRVFSEDRKGFTTVVVSVNPRHFNRDDMTKLAMQLDREFAEKPKLKVGLLDDDNIARLFATGRAELSTYYTAERGRYYLDRTACREYIQFSTKRGKPRETIRLKCRR